MKEDRYVIHSVWNGKTNPIGNTNKEWWEGKSGAFTSSYGDLAAFAEEHGFKSPWGVRRYYKTIKNNIESNYTPREVDIVHLKYLKASRHCESFYMDQAMYEDLLTTTGNTPPDQAEYEAALVFGDKKTLRKIEASL